MLNGVEMKTDKKNKLQITTQDLLNLLSMVQQSQLPDVLHVMDVEKILRISHYTCLELVKQQEFPSMKIGRHHKIPRDAFFEWLTSAAKEKRKISIT